VQVEKRDGQGAVQRARHPLYRLSNKIGGLSNAEEGDGDLERTPSSPIVSCTRFTMDPGVRREELT